MVYEAEAGEGEGKSFAERWLWSRQPVERDDGVNGDVSEGGEGRGREESQFMITDEDEEEEAVDGRDVEEGAKAFKAVVGHPPRTNGTAEKTDEAVIDPLSQQSPATEHYERAGKDEQVQEGDTIPCLVDRLFSCTIDLLFCAGFTVPESVRGQDGTGEKINVGALPGSSGRADRRST